MHHGREARVRSRRAPKKVIDRSRDKTIDAGESPECGKAHRDEYGERMVSILQEIMDFGRGKTPTLVVTRENSSYMAVSEHGTYPTRIKLTIFIPIG